MNWCFDILDLVKLVSQSLKLNDDDVISKTKCLS